MTCPKIYLVPVICPPLNLPNGELTYQGSALNGSWTVGTIASFFCKFGYSISESSTRTCQYPGNWTGQNPTCNQGSKVN